MSPRAGQFVSAAVSQRKGCESIIHDHNRDLWVTKMGGWKYQILTGVTSDVGVLSTYLGCYFFRLQMNSASENIYDDIAGAN